MHPPIFVREPSDAERARLEAALRASDAFTVRRAQIVRASAEGRRPRAIARDLRCAVQTVRNGVRAFNAAGLAALTAGSSRPRSAAPVLGEAEPAPGLGERARPGAGAGRGGAGAAAGDPAPAAARLRPPEEHLDPRPPGAGGARAGAEPGRPLGGDDPAGVAAARGGLEAGRALAHQPRSRLRARKRRRDRLIGLARGRPGWASGFQDEVWFSRLAQPSLHAWAADGERPRLAARAPDPAAPEPKALARYGLWLPGPERMLLRLVAGRPVSGITRAFLAWVADRFVAGRPVSGITRAFLGDYREFRVRAGG